jgi:hypothetical protein
MRPRRWESCRRRAGDGCAVLRCRRRPLVRPIADLSLGRPLDLAVMFIRRRCWPTREADLHCRSIAVTRAHHLLFSVSLVPGRSWCLIQCGTLAGRRLECRRTVPRRDEARSNVPRERVFDGLVSRSLCGIFAIGPIAALVQSPLVGCCRWLSDVEEDAAPEAQRPASRGVNGCCLSASWQGHPASRRSSAVVETSFRMLRA